MYQGASGTSLCDIFVFYFIMATLEDVEFEDIGGTNDDSIEEPIDDRRETNNEG